MRIPVGRVLVLTVLAVCLPLLGARAQSSLPPEVLHRIQQEAEASRAFAAREAALAMGLGNPQLAATMGRKARRRADTALTFAVVSIIATNRALAPAVVDAAVAAAPGSRESIVSGVAAAFPNLAGRIGVSAAPPSSTAFVTPFPAPAPLGTAPRPLEGEARPPSVREKIHDPFESINRVIFVFNDTLDTLIFRPVATIYGFITPEVAKESIRNIFGNLQSPVILANDLIQLTFEDAGVTTARFVINSTVGLGGLFEVATDLGFPPHHADFGQTLHSYGVGQGFYVMLPLIGPSTARDGVGKAVDSLFQPLNYYLETEVSFGVSLSDGITRRETLIVALDDLRAGSIDFYAAIRGAFYQDRAVELQKGREDSASAIDALFADID